MKRSFNMLANNTEFYWISTLHMIDFFHLSGLNILVGSIALLVESPMKALEVAGSSQPETPF